MSNNFSIPIKLIINTLIIIITNKTIYMDYSILISLKSVL